MPVLEYLFLFVLLHHVYRQSYTGLVFKQNYFRGFMKMKNTYILT